MRIDNPKSPSDGAASTGAMSLLDLGEDILALIIEELSATSPHSISSLALAHSLCARLARGCRYRKIDFDHSPVARERLSAVRDKGLLSSVRSLTIQSTNEWDESHDWALIGKALPEMTGLREITIPSNDVPSSIVHTIRSFAKTRLHLLAKPFSEEECLRLEQFTNVAQLYSLDLQVATNSGDVWRAATKALKAVLLSCSNIRVLKVNINLPRSSCIIGRQLPAGYSGCGFRDGERPPPLEALELFHYPFGWKLKTQQVWRGYTPNAESEMDYWARMFDWSKLRRLKTANASFAAAMIPYLPALKDLELVDLTRNECEAFKEVHDSIDAGLEHISAPNLDCIGLQNLLRHGSYLTSLRLHNPSVSNDYWEKDEESVDESALRAINQGCPNLQGLHIDLARRGDWPYSIFDVLACMPRLQTLTLYCELEDWTDDYSSDGLIHPLVTFASASSIYEYLQDHRPPTSSQPGLELYVVSGWPPPPPRGRVDASVYFFARDNCATFKCAPSERDDEAARGIFVTTCLGLSTSMNKALQEALETSKALEKRLRSLPIQQVDGKSPGASRAHQTATKRIRDIARRHESPDVSRRLRIAWEGPNPVNPEELEGRRQTRALENGSEGD
ncbi:hypothetical protein CC79DRAFT_1132858 [Sarocladium strictum]